MRQLFFRFYLSVLAVLFSAWFIHGTVFKNRSEADRERVIAKAHAGGARLVASEITTTPPESRAQVLDRMRECFGYPVEVLPLVQLPSAVQRRIAAGEDVFSYRLKSGGDVVGAALSGRSEIVRLGPFPDYGRNAIEDSIRGWMRLTADRLNSDSDRQGALTRLQERFDFPVVVVSRSDLPKEPLDRIAGGREVAFYSPGNDRYYAATPLRDGADMVRFGPFPNYERIEEKAATTTLALVLLPAALAIALLLRPVARQLRQVEKAAKAIAAGDLSARVDERRIGSAKALAGAFNHMAGRTESLVRTQRELLQAVSHELRTPLSRMRFAIGLIEAAKDDTERRQRLDSLDAAAEDLDELVEELLRYVRMETTEPMLHPEQVDVKDALEVLVPKYAALYPSIEFGASDDIDRDQATVFADRLGFERALGNLLSNAGRFARSKVAVSTETTDGTIAVNVDDDGRGIPESDRERVLEPFVRLDDGKHEHHRGVGLGLALVKRIVTQHGGSVALLTSPLGGCRARTVWPHVAAATRGASPLSTATA